jgi:signal peptidase I
MEPLTIHPRPTTPARTEYSTPPHLPPRPHHPLPVENDENFLVEIFKFAILALLIVVPFRFFVAQPFIVSGASMSPTFETGQYLIVDQVTYRFHEPQRGDVVIFRYPNDPSKYFIKRLIGLPGEVVELANGGTTVTNPTSGESHTLEEPYIKTDRTDDHLTITLSSDEYFVMGDNRGASSDSRVWGPVPKKNIVGRAFLRLLPPVEFGLLPGVYVQEQDTSVETPSQSS